MVLGSRVRFGVSSLSIVSGAPSDHRSMSVRLRTVPIPDTVISLHMYTHVHTGKCTYFADDETHVRVHAPINSESILRPVLQISNAQNSVTVVIWLTPIVFSSTFGGFYLYFVQAVGVESQNDLNERTTQEVLTRIGPTKLNDRKKL